MSSLLVSRVSCLTSLITLANMQTSENTQADPLALVNAPIWRIVLANTVLTIVAPIPFVTGAVGRVKGTVPLHSILAPRTFVRSATGPDTHGSDTHENTRITWHVGVG